MLPMLLGGLALISVGKAAKDFNDAARISNEARKIDHIARRRYDEAKKKMDKYIQGTEKKLEDLGILQIEIGQSFGNFEKLVGDLLEKINISEKIVKQKEIDSTELCKLIKIDGYRLTQISRIEKSAQKILCLAGGTAGGLSAGVAAGYAVWGSVTAFGSASTGMAITTLSGAAATNATLATIGGGALAAGGFGIAGGTAILGGIVAAPVLAIAGWARKSNAKEILEDAEKYEYEVDEIIKKFDTIIEKQEDIQVYLLRVYSELKGINRLFIPFIEKLKTACKMTDEEINQASEVMVQDISNGYMLAAILADIISTPLFVMKLDVDKKTDKKINVPMQDENGIMIPNESNMQEILKESRKY